MLSLFCFLFRLVDFLLSFLSATLLLTTSKGYLFVTFRELAVAQCAFSNPASIILPYTLCVVLLLSFFLFLCLFYHVITFLGEPIC